MLKIIVEAITYIFAIYGFTCFVSGLVRQIKCSKNEYDNIRYILAVKDAQDVIEGIVKLYYIEQANRRIPWVKGLHIIDMGSTDQTLQILNRLKTRYSDLVVITDSTDIKL